MGRRSVGGGLLAAAALVPSVSAALPVLTYRYASFAAPDPPAAAAFLARYTGGTVLSSAPSDEEWLIAPSSPEAVTAGVRLSYAAGAGFSDVYFSRDDTLPGNATAFGEKLARQMTFAQDDWSWWQDWHLAFHSDQIDAVASALLADGVPFVSRGSLYFAIPGAGLTIQILGDPTVYWTEPFAFCRLTGDATTAKLAPYPLNVTAIPSTGGGGGIPQGGTSAVELVPSHQSLAVSDASACAAWTRTALALAEVDESTAPGESHAYANGTCASIKWFEIDAAGYEIHWIEQFRKRDGGVRVADVEARVRALNGDSDAGPAENAFTQYRVGFSVADQSDLDAYAAAFRAAGVAVASVEDGTRLRIAAPSGYILEIFVLAPVADHGLDAAEGHRRRFRDDLKAAAAIRAAPSE